jgi:SNF2 family DNA or RNA helicase
MFSGLKRLVGSIDVYEDDKLIHIEGLPADVIQRDITKIWSTSKIAMFMFTKMGRSEVTFNKFFAPDVLYTFETILKLRSRNYNNRALKKIVDLLYQNTWLKAIHEDSHANILDFSNLDELNVKLLPHQLEFLEIYNEMVPKMKLKGYVLAAAPGSGKTINSIALGCVLNADVFIEIVPKPAVDEVWDKTLRTLFKNTAKHSYWTTLSGKPLEWGYRHYVFHYEQLPKAIEFFKANKAKLRKPIMIVDESHNLNELDSLRTNLWIDLCKVTDCQHVLPMSGTPMKAIGAEAIPILTVLCNDFNPDAQLRFKEIFGKNSVRANDILRNRLGAMMYKVDNVVDNSRKEIQRNVAIPNGDAYTLDAVKDVMRKFIEERLAYYVANMKGFQQIYHTACSVYERSIRNGADMNEYKKYQGYISQIIQFYDPKTMKDMVMFCNKFEKQKIAPVLPRDLKISFLDARSVVKYVNLKVQGEALGRILGRLRSQCHVDMIPYVGMPELIDGSLSKTLIFTSYVNVVKETDAYLQREGYKPLLVYGETNKDLKGIIKRFDEDEDLNPLIATYDSLSTAVPVISASTMINLNAPFRDYEYKQATARIDRIGQKFPVTIWNVFLDTKGVANISTRSNDILNWSREMVDSIMGTSSAGLDVALESYTLLQKAERYELAMETFNDGGNEGKGTDEPAVDAGSIIVQPNWMSWTNA